MREKDIQTRTKVNNRPVCMYNVHQNVDFINTNLKLIGISLGILAFEGCWTVLGEAILLEISG